MLVKLMVMKDWVERFSRKDGTKVVSRRVTGIEEDASGFAEPLEVEVGRSVDGEWQPDTSTKTCTTRGTVGVQLTGLRVWQNEVRFLGSFVGAK